MVAGRVPPCNLEAEVKLLGQMFFAPEDIDRVVAQGFRAEHFFDRNHQLIFESMLELHHEAGMHVDLPLLAQRLREKNQLDRIGGTPFLATLDLMPSESSRVETYARVVIEHWKSRAVIASAQQTIAQLYMPLGHAAKETIDSHESRLFELAYSGAASAYENAGDIAGRALSALTEALAKGGSLLGTTTGFIELDKKTTGFYPGDLIIVAGRPGAGKTAAVCSMLLKISEPPSDGSLADATYLHSLEMPKEQLALRLVCSMARVELTKLRQNQLTSGDWTKLFDATKRLQQYPLFIDDKPAVTVTEIRSNIRKLKREIQQGKVKARKLVGVGIDYLQLAQGDKSQSREREISSITQDCKNTAKSEGVFIVALSQLNRSVETRGGKKGPGEREKGKRPELSDLRESGAIEQDADTVIFIFRPKYYDPDANDEAEFIVAKQRNGPTGTVIVVFDAVAMTYRNMAHGHEIAAPFGDFGDDEDGLGWGDEPS